MGLGQCKHSGDILIMLDFDKANHDRSFKRRRLYLVTRAYLNTW